MNYKTDSNGEPMKVKKYNLKDESDYYEWQCEDDEEPNINEDDPRIER